MNKIIHNTLPPDVVLVIYIDNHLYLKYFRLQNEYIIDQTIFGGLRVLLNGLNVPNLHTRVRKKLDGGQLSGDFISNEFIC